MKGVVKTAATDEAFVFRCENGVQVQNADFLCCIVLTEPGLTRSQLKHF